MDFVDFAFGDDCGDSGCDWTSGFSACYGRGFAGFGEGGVFTFFFLYRGWSDEYYDGDDDDDDDDDEYGRKLVLYYFYLVS